MAGNGGFDSVFFSPQQSGPGGAAVMNLGNVGAGNVQSATVLKNGTSQVIAAPGSGGSKIAPIIWMFVFLIAGYWGLHQCLKAV